MYEQYKKDTSVLPIFLSHFLESPSKSITQTTDPYYSLKEKDCTMVVDSCNGLLCLVGCSNEIWFRVWNPATRTISDKLGHADLPDLTQTLLKFTFGYDNSTDTYKVVALEDAAARVFSLGDNVWRNIHFPVYFYLDDGVHLNGSVNLLAIRDYIRDYYDPRYITVEQVTIISLDLGTETYKEFSPLEDLIKSHMSSHHYLC
ncbi:putative F-box associated interaction domain-containing protein [Medicago truncatula]|uniref:Putative F-box associated interaction domain-containing protein n=1 Tax=Medicago truncatula TaxID=3880 RepID=A0A396GYC0_MEDTR|nr:putative F-box associated interaction domain-containing protein [Medicago truncatula]